MIKRTDKSKYYNRIIFIRLFYFPSIKVKTKYLTEKKNNFVADYGAIEVYFVIR